ncbi:hypothetical protein ACLMJK_005453 [Lecanora helva]
MATASSLTSDHVNYLIWSSLANHTIITKRYLQESGHGEAAVKLQQHWLIDPQTLPFAQRIKTHALVSLVQKGLQYYQFEQSIDQPGNRNTSAATLFFGAESARASSLPNRDQNDDDVRNSPRQRKHPRESNVNGLGLDLPAQTPAPKRNRRSNGTDNTSSTTTNGDRTANDNMQIDNQDGYDYANEPPEPVSPTHYSSVEDAQTMNGMDIDDDATAHHSPTPDQQLTLTLTNGESKGVQSDKVDQLGPQTSILTVPDNTHVEHTAWNPKDPTILAVGGEALCRLWYISKSASSGDNPNHKSYIDILDPSYGSLVTTMAWSPNGETLAVATRDDSSEWVGAVCLWSKMGKALDELPAAHDMVLTLRWSPSGNQLLGITSSGDNSSSLTLWDVQSSQAALPHQMTKVVTDAAWTSNNQLTICGHDVIASSLLEEGRILTLHSRPEPVALQSWTHVRYDSRTHTTALAAEDSGILGLIDSSNTLRIITAHEAEITALAYQPVTNLSAYPASDPRLVATSSLDGTIKVWDAKRPFTLIHTLNLGHTTPAMAMAFTPDGFLVAATNGNRVLIWSAEAGGVPKASWKGLLGKLPNGLLTNGNDVDQPMVGDGLAEPNPSLSWDAEGGKLAMGVGSQV